MRISNISKFDRKLPPLGLSPGHLSNPGTPGSNLWNSLLTATGQSQDKKTGLTPNESNLRTGLTPGGNLNFNFGSNVPGLTTPSLLMNSPMTPGLSSLLGLTNNNNNNTNNNSSTNNNLHNNSQPHLNSNTNPNTTTNPTINNNNIINNTNGTRNLHQLSNLSLQQQQQHQQSQTSHPVFEPILENENSDESQSTSSKRENSDQNPSKKKQKVEPTPTRKSRSSKRDGKKTVETSKDSKPELKKEQSRKAKTDDDKRKNFLERNRVAASKCRQRKKQLINKMEEELSFYSNGYRELSAQINQLRDQLISLKGIIIGHKDCQHFAQSVGGYDQLNHIIQQANYITQITSNTQQSVTSIPTTIPTTLNNPAIDNNGGYNQQTPAAPTQAIAPVLPIPNQMMDSMQPQMNQGLQPKSILNVSSSHHSMTDLPAAEAKANQNLITNDYTMRQLGNNEQPERGESLMGVNGVVMGMVPPLSQQQG